MAVADGGSAAERPIAEGKGYVVVQNDHLALVGQLQVAGQPVHLGIGKLARLIVRGSAVELDVIETHIVHIATVKGVVGGAPGLFPLGLVDGVAVLVVVANH